ncbi:hypothetical protein [Brevibacillus sp. SYSU BS000544]
MIMAVDMHMPPSKTHPTQAIASGRLNATSLLHHRHSHVLSIVGGAPNL